MEWRICRCEVCGKFLGKMRILDITEGAQFSLQVVLKCYNRECNLSRDAKLRGENNLTIKTKPIK